MIFKQNNLSPGEEAEQKARIFLEKHGLICLKKNYRCKLGEIDLIMKDANILIFVEVRMRNNPRYGSPLESVTHKKQQKVSLAAQHYLNQNSTLQTQPIRFDVIGIYQESIDWIKGAF